MTPLDSSLIILLLIACATLWRSITRWRSDLARHQDELSHQQQAHLRQLEQTQRDHQHLLDGLNDALLIIDRSGRIHLSNRAACHLAQSLTLIGRPILETFTDPRLIDALQSGIQSKLPYQTTIQLPLSNSDSPHHEPSTIRTLLVDTAKLDSLTNTDSSLTRVIIRDITKEHQADQVRRDFIANASHELRTPMAIIGGYLENLIDDDVVNDVPTSRRFLEIMRKHSNRMSRIIDDMLLISRLEAGTNEHLKLESFPLADAFNDVVERLESMIRNQQAEVRISLPNPPLHLMADRFYFTQILFNLTENAIKQNPRPGLTIELGARQTNTHIEIWVSDNGIGIPMSDLPHIFRRFYRVDKHHSQSDIKGTGLGLSIVKRAIEAHGGTIAAHSSPGILTRFDIQLPLHPLSPSPSL